MRVKQYTLVGITADDNGIVTSTNTVAGTPLTLEAVAASLDPPRELSFDGSADISGITFTIVGTDRWGQPITEEVTGVTATAVRTRKVYASVTSITPDTTDAVNTVIVGWEARVPSPWMIADTTRSTDDVPIAQVATEIVSGTPDGQIESTFENVMQITGEGAYVDDVTATAPPDTNPVPACAFFRYVLTTAGTLKVRAIRPGF